MRRNLQRPTPRRADLLHLLAQFCHEFSHHPRTVAQIPLIVLRQLRCIEPCLRSEAFDQWRLVKEKRRAPVEYRVDAVYVITSSQFTKNAQQ